MPLDSEECTLFFSTRCLFPGEHLPSRLQQTATTEENIEILLYHSCNTCGLSFFFSFFYSNISVMKSRVKHSQKAHRGLHGKIAHLLHLSYPKDRVLQICNVFPTDKHFCSRHFRVPRLFPVRPFWCAKTKHMGEQFLSFYIRQQEKRLTTPLIRHEMPGNCMKYQGNEMALRNTWDN